MNNNDKHPKICINCEYRIESSASGLQHLYNGVVSTCQLNYAYEIINELRGTYVPCCKVLNNNIYKCIKLHERIKKLD